MGKQDDRQSRFGAIEGLLAVTAVVALSAVGLLFYPHQPKGPVEKSTAPSSSQTTEQQQLASAAIQPVQTAVPYLDITQWGVRMTLSRNAASLYYYIDPQIPDVAYLSLKTVSDIAPNCAANKGSLAAIGRLTDAEHQAIVSGSAPGNPGTVHIGGYWYSYQKSPADCTEGSAATRAAVDKAAPSYNFGTLRSAFNTLTAD
jgi:hypothetical protein